MDAGVILAVAAKDIGDFNAGPVWMEAGTAPGGLLILVASLPATDD
jgi:hypothetical protein